MLYFGEKRWNKPRSLKDCLDVPKELEPYISDYKVNVFEIAWLEPETVKKFKSDFGIVADYFVQMRRNKDYKPSSETIRHVHEILQLMAVITGDDRFSEAQGPLADSYGQGGVTMCEFLDRVENRGIAIGESRGIAIGEQQTESRMMSLFNKLFKDGRVADVERATTDREYLKKLFEEYQK